MRRPRMFHRAAAAGARVEIERDDAHHLVHVLRRSVGDVVLLLDGSGGVFEAVVREISSRGERVIVDVTAPLEEPLAPILALHVAVAVPRGDGLETAIRMASETGLEGIQPLLTARTVARPAAGSSKVRRWRRIARESAEQCRRPTPLSVGDPLAWRDFLALCGEAGERARGHWIAHPGGPLPAESGLLSALASPGVRLTVAVGPEGGFAPGELEEATDRGFLPLGLPTPVLRTPTAVVYLGALGSLVFAGSAGSDGSEGEG